jgi:hypothetical protein
MEGPGGGVQVADFGAAPLRLCGMLVQEDLYLLAEGDVAEVRLGDETRAGCCPDHAVPRAVLQKTCLYKKWLN